MPAPERITSVRPVSTDTGAQFQARRVAIGMSVKALAERAGVDRGSIAKLEAGEKVRMTTVGAIDKALSDLEHEYGMDLPSQVETLKAPTATEPGVVRVKVEGVYGAKALIVEAPPENLPELEAMVDRIMRNLRDSGDE